MKRSINDLALSLIGLPVDDIVLAPPHTVPKTSSGKIRRVAARDYYERGPDAVRPQAVWLQFLRLAAAGVAPQLRRGWRVARGMAFALRAYLLFAVIAPFVFAAAATRNVTCLESGRRDDAALPALSGLTLLVRGRETSRPDRWCWRPTTRASMRSSWYRCSAAPFAFIAKREFLGNPVMRLLLVGLGCVFVERFDVQKSAEHADELVDAAKRGRSLAIFPEGTLQRRPGLLPFRTGAFQVAVQAGVPVLRSRCAACARCCATAPGMRAAIRWP